ncbi:MAG: spinster family MFS transporter [Alphaproteobacteria bacterium]
MSRTGVTAGALTDDWPSARLGWFAVSILSLAYILSYVDRIIINLLVGPIKETFAISDTQFGMLQGLAFGLFYTLAALPLGRLVDSRSRRAIAAGGIVVFSLFSILSGLAKSYWQLFAARVGVGAGEASLTPAAYSIISDYFPPEKLGRAISVFTMSAFVGIGVAYIAGGTVVAWLSSLDNLALPLIGEIQPWQMAFIVVGLPGFLVAALLFAIREPVRRGLRGGESAAVPVRVVAGEIMQRRKALLPLFAGFSMITLSGYASAVWTPAFLIRTYEWTPLDVGLWYGLTYLAVGPAGAIFGGWWCDRLTKQGHLDAPLRVAAFGYVGSGLFGGLAPLMPSAELALLVFAPAIFMSTIPYPMAGTALQLIAPNQIRGQLSALYMTVINVVGLGLGPMIVGLFTDFVFMDEGDVRYSLAIVNAFCAPAACLFLVLGFKHYAALRQATPAEA